MKNQVTVHFVLTVILEYQPEQVYTVTCKELPELITEGKTIDDALDNTIDAFVSVLELYEDLGKDLPESIYAEKKPDEYSKYRSIFSARKPSSLVSFNLNELNTPPREVYLQA